MKKVLAGLIGMGLLLVVSGCNISAFVDGSKNTPIMVEKDQAKKLQVDMDIGVGNLHVIGGADGWLEGKIQYEDKNLKPDVSYTLQGKEGRIAIDQMKKKNSYLNLNGTRNEWDLALNDNIPIDLNVNSGATDTTLDINGLRLSRLEVNAGVGDMKIDLSGNWKKSFDVDLKMGVGESTIILPKDVGVKITSEKGIGRLEFGGFISKGNGVYVNKAYEDADVIIDVDMNTGVGETIFKME